jgi:hypothetical protein
MHSGPITAHGGMAKLLDDKSRLGVSDSEQLTLW